jgi:hypothetical protein
VERDKGRRRWGIVGDGVNLIILQGLSILVLSVSVVLVDATRKRADSSIVDEVVS